MKHNKKAFTLIELLVVVLIIGILAAIALPQYEKAVWKSRLVELITNTKAIQDCFDMYVLQNGLPASEVNLKDMGCAAELTGGQWSGDSYLTEYFEYYEPYCDNSMCYLYTFERKGNTGLATKIRTHHATPFKRCYTNRNEKGRFLCRTLESQGYQYVDESD